MHYFLLSCNSINQYAENFLLLLGKGRGKDFGLNTIKQQMVHLGVISNKTNKDSDGNNDNNSGEFNQHDGSGLSRMNFISANIIVRLLNALSNKNNNSDSINILHEFGSFSSLLPSNCAIGSLHSRLCALPKGIITGKTGTMTGISALSGYIHSLSSSGKTSDVIEKDTAVFSIIVNNSELSQIDREAVIDEIISLLVQHVEINANKAGLQN